MRWYPRLGIFKASNVTFNPDTCEAYSYEWWRFVERIDGKVVFNSYRYSSMTSKHQWKVRKLLAHLGIAIDLEIEAPRGLDRLDMAVSHYGDRIALLEIAIATPRSQAKKNAERKAKIAEYRRSITTIKRLIKIQETWNK
jgi:hypothetical protein